ncbi:uncharacterized protein LOC127286400 [Leptopilina boulardi]|uniref:uncharacterized protein LOC127286400 n=1 Tax=Leptopilina boulardi TaxID=63433 RepID=UPI0021F59A42|nr:uncharacterized protein LOC127286400 [Leptopilina boulardi]
MFYELINLTSEETSFLNKSDKQEISTKDQNIFGASKNQNQPSDDASDSIVQEYFKKIVRLFTIIHYNLQNIDKKLDNSERTQVSTTANDFTILSHFIPVNNIMSINHFEMLITTDNDAVIQFRKMLNQTGGRSVKDCIYRSLRKIFTNSCAIQCSWQGRKNNFKVSNLSFMRIMKETFCTTFPHLTEAEFEAIAAEWFRFAKQRLTREETRMMNRTDPLQSDQN